MESYGLTPEQIAEYSERGRRMAAQSLRENPDKLQEVEAMAGRAYCMQRYPESYPNFRES